MTPLQRFYNQIPNGLANAFRNNWTNITSQTDGYFRMLLGFAKLEDEKKTDFVKAAVATFRQSDPEGLYNVTYLRRIINDMAMALTGKEAV